MTKMRGATRKAAARPAASTSVATAATALRVTALGIEDAGVRLSLSIVIGYVAAKVLAFVDAKLPG